MRDGCPLPSTSPRRAYRRRLAGFTAPYLAALCLAAPAIPALARAATDEKPPPDLLQRLNMALAAKRLCSAVFVSGRDAEEGWRASAGTWLSPQAHAARERGELRFTIDHAERRVTAEWGGAQLAAAGAFGDQGCVILPEGARGVLFTPVEVVSTLPPADELDWPMGDREPEAPLPPALDGSPVDRAKLEAAAEAAFADPADHTAAFVAIYRGRIVGERYGPGVDRDMQLESWSMGKSVTATLVGLLIEEGALELWGPAPVPEWHDVPGDPRAAIRVADLLRMSSGLFFTHASDPPERLARSYLTGHPDHSLGYAAPVDVFQLSISRPLEHPPGTVGRYRNCDPLTLGYLVKRIVEERGESYLRWPQRALFDRIGIRRQVLETDVYGNFVLTGFDFGTARAWARLGLLWLEDGVWRGERLLPEGFVEFTRTSAPGWPDDVYGGLFWLDHEALPEGSFSMRGAGGQEVAIVPSHHLVLVRLGHSAGWPLEGSARAQEERRDRAYQLVLEAVGGGGGGSAAPRPRR